SMSTKTPYAAEGSHYTAPPQGFHAVNTQVVARHGSRGLSGFKYDALTMKVWQKAHELGAVKPAGRSLHQQTEAMHEANEALGDEATWAQMAGRAQLTGGDFKRGYGNLTPLGAREHEQMGERLAHCMPELFDGGSGTTVDLVSSGEPRAAESGWHFRSGLLKAAPQAAGNVSETIRSDTATLYFHKDKNNADYQAYHQYLSGDRVKSYVDSVWNQPKSKKYARSVLTRIYSEDFVDRLAAGEWTFDIPSGKKIDNEVDAAVQLYSLYIVAPALGMDFSQYFTPEEANWFAMLLDAEDYVQKGPGFVGSDISYRNSRPLLDDFFASIDRQSAEHPDGSATLRFAHAETLIPFEALIKAPGSQTQITASDLDFWKATDWRGASQGRMAANVQWDVFANDQGQQVIRMLLNEREVPFGGTCRAIGDGSVFYTVPELKRCLTGASVPADSWRVATPQQSGAPSPQPGDRTPSSPAPASPDSRGETVADGSGVPGAKNVMPDTVAGNVPGFVDGGRPGLPGTGD
ncbi:MAG: histidine-type phosphatase, partial [Cutibacterium granulosum]|nr:histidine-type phosphatase [Cutibacterium granulosum]